MKKLFISATPIAMFFTELPLIATLVLSIIFNSKVESLPRLYPLIIVSAAGIIFTFIYLFRMVVISYEEIKIIGRFSSRDKAIINKDKTLILTIRPKGRLIVTLFGNDGERPALDWAQGEDYVPVDINLFREKVEGKFETAKKILRYFDISETDIEKISSAEDFNREYKDFLVSSENREKTKEIKIKFKETL